MSARASNTYVLSITHLKDRPNEKYALELLKKVVSLVKPIMRKHGWILPELAEFFPGQDNLLGMNVNRGQKILLRLRPPHSPTWFFEEEEIIGTMLHELTHNVHGPHDDKFYKFLSKLQDEYDELQRKGYAGEGFFTPGQRLGGSGHNPAPHVGRAKALEAAEKRKQQSRVLGGGSRKLGGLSSGTVSGTGRGGRVLSPREMAAQAAERRIRDAKECGSQQSPAAIQRESEKASREGFKSDVIDLTWLDDDDQWEPDWISDTEKPQHGDDDDDDEVIIVEDVHVAPARPRPPRQPQAVAGPSDSRSRPGQASGGSSSSKVSSGSRAASDPYPKSALGKAPLRSILKPPRPPASSSSSRHAEWACQICTLVNRPSALECDACGIRRPPDEKMGWECLACGETGMQHDFWTCRRCGTIKVSS